MSWVEKFFSFWKKPAEPMPPRPKIYDEVEVAFWQSNTYRAENAELDHLEPTRLRISSYWNLRRGNKMELNLTLPEEFPCTSHSLRVHAVVLRCQRPRGRRRFRIDCQIKDIDVTTAERIQEFKDWALKQV